MFQATVDSRPHLSDVKKLTYFLGRFRDNAKAAVAGFPNTTADYSAVIADLKSLCGYEKEVDHRLQLELRRLFNPRTTRPIYLSITQKFPFWAFHFPSNIFAKFS
ncbi:unnamed protein product [Toxocara canis]|uniref:Uncharacterized protein n=1 Tax=Toxocara canis TaxID=6265 RepID=A0A183TX39_TOXCA|nr:unnamed protein product [Toxocara canis]